MARPVAKNKSVSRKQVAQTRRKTPDKSITRVAAEPSAIVHKLIADLESVILKTLPKATGNVYGGAKVQVKLFSIGDSRNVICGVQARDNGCLLYLHHILPADSSLLAIEGQGKHTLHVRLTELTPTMRKEVERLLKLAASRTRAKQ
jgi:hypothetical protein